MELLLGYKILRAKFIPVYDQAALIAVVPHFAGNHLYRHTDLYGAIVHIGQLGGDHRSLIQLYESDSIRRVAVIATWGFINRGKRVHLTLAAECIELFGFITTVRADIAGRKNLMVAVRTNLANQSVALLLESPVSWDFHKSIPFSKTNSIEGNSQRLSSFFSQMQWESG
jgi:hypothetical protein